MNGRDHITGAACMAHRDHPTGAACVAGERNERLAR